MITGGPGYPPYKPRKRRMRTKWIVLGLLLLIACAGPLIGLWLGSLPAGVGQTIFGFLAFLALFCLFFGAVGRPGEGREEE